uniref:LETM1 domain-containing protein n=1 Tax=Ascaris lumbricoides TaxID=6252 RepID=A0A0M3HR02_ASCLU
MVVPLAHIAIRAPVFFVVRLKSSLLQHIPPDLLITLATATERKLRRKLDERMQRLLVGKEAGLEGDISE